MRQEFVSEGCVFSIELCALFFALGLRLGTLVFEKTSLITFQPLRLKHTKTQDQRPKTKALNTEHARQRIEYRTSVRGKMRTDGGICANVRILPCNISLAFTP